MQASRLRRSAFTLFSLLVLLGVSGLLMAMFFPAVLKVREAAQRASSQNNLKQLGLGLHNYADSFQKFPTVGVGDPDRNMPESGSWCFRLLPYIEQDQLFQLNGGNVPVGTFIHATRRPVRLYDGLPKTDYAGNTGTGDAPVPPGKEREDGAFTKAGTRFADIVDGTSNTLLFGEKGLRTTDYLTGKGAGDTKSCWIGGTSDTLRSSNGAKRPPKRDPADEDNERGFGAPTERVCNFAFCDGSVRTIRYKIDGKVFQALAGRDDGLAVNPNDL